MPPAANAHLVGQRVQFKPGFAEEYGFPPGTVYVAEQPTTKSMKTKWLHLRPVDGGDRVERDKHAGSGDAYDRAPKMTAYFKFDTLDLAATAGADGSDGAAAAATTSEGRSAETPNGDDEIVHADPAAATADNAGTADNAINLDSDSDGDLDG